MKPAEQEMVTNTLMALFDGGIIGYEVALEVPEEIKQARRVSQDRDRITSQAQEEAERIVARAQQRAEELLEERGLLQLAEERADDLLREAEGNSRELRQDAEEYAREVLQKLDQYMDDILTEVRRGGDALSDVPAPLIESEEPEPVTPA